MSRDEAYALARKLTAGKPHNGVKEDCKVCKEVEELVETLLERPKDELPTQNQ